MIQKKFIIILPTLLLALVIVLLSITYFYKNYVIVAMSIFISILIYTLLTHYYIQKKLQQNTHKSPPPEKAPTNTTPYQDAFETAPIAIIITSIPDLQEIYNKESVRLLAVDDNKKTANIPCNIDGSPYEATELPITITMQTSQKSEKKDIYIKQKDNSLIPVLYESHPVIENGTLVSIVTIIRDITIQTELEAQKSAIVSLASHQLRTPLTSMRWYIEYLKDETNGKLNETQTEFLNQLDQSTSRMTDTINSLVNVTRIELGTFTEAPQKTNIINEVNKVLTEIKPLTIEYNQKIDLSIQGITTDVLIDQNIFKFSLANLLSNAVKYSPKGGNVKLSIDKVSENGEKIKITVTDTGFGIPKSDITKVFTKLFRASNITNKDTYGNGLGLYAIKSMLDKCGGSISFTTEENKGSIFTIKIPITI